MRHFLKYSAIAFTLISSAALAADPVAPVATIPMVAAQPGGFDTLAQFAIIKDMTTGEVLYDKNAAQQMVPSSMTKLMTLYIAFERIKEGKLKLTDTLPVSERAWRIQGSKMFVELGNNIKVDDLLHGIIIQSGNDACVVIAEGIAGSEQAFAVLMNETAKRLGMNDSHFLNSNGWPEPGHVMSARDLATLAEHLVRDFPEDYALFSKTSFTYHGITQGNRNLLLYKNIGVDGLKTGHTEEAGYGMTTSAKRGNRRLIVVVNGLKSDKERAEESAKLLEYGFSAFENYKLFSKEEVMGEAEVWYGDKASIPLVAKDEVIATLPRAIAEQHLKEASAVIRYQGPLKAPIQAGDKVAELELKLPNQQPRILPLYAGESVEPLSFTGRILHSAKLLVGGK